MTMGGGQFPDTVWSRIREAADQKSSAVREFISHYQEPVRKFVVAYGVSPSEADDLTQEVFITVFEKRLLEIADSKKGRFRSFILGITKNVLGNWHKKGVAVKRGGGRRAVSLDQKVRPEGDTVFADLLASPQNDDSFDLYWMEHVVERALERLRAACAREKLPYFDALSKFMNGASYQDIADERNANLQQVKNYIHRGRKKLIEFIRAEIAGYCSTKEEYQQELHLLAKFFKEGA